MATKAKAPKAYAKGEQVWFVRSWDSKASYVITPLTVYSCGAKQMVLVDEGGERFAGHNFTPARVQGGYVNRDGSYLLALSTVERGTLEEVIAIAREMAAAQQKYEVETARRYAAESASAGYRECMTRRADEIERAPVTVRLKRAGFAVPATVVWPAEAAATVAP